MKQQEILNTFKNLCAEYDVELNVPVVINKRFKRTLGRVNMNLNTLTGYMSVTKVDFAAILEKEDDEFTRQIILHEFCHYYLVQKTHKDHCHRDKCFKEMCARVGCYQDGYAVKN